MKSSHPLFAVPESYHLNRDANKFTSAQLSLIKEAAPENLFLFGYANIEQAPTGYFHFESPSRDLVGSFQRFKSLNLETLEFVTEKREKASQVRFSLKENRDEDFYRSNQ